MSGLGCCVFNPSGLLKDEGKWSAFQTECPTAPLPKVHLWDIHDQGELFTPELLPSIR